MGADFQHLVLVRYGEIGLKGGNRPQFERLLASRIKARLGKRVESRRGRMFVSAGSHTEASEMAARLSRVFGVVAASPALRAPLDVSALKEAALTVLQGESGAASFKVEARRPNKRFALDSIALNREIGGHLADAMPGIRVDVHDPEVVVHVEVRDEAGYVFSGGKPGPGGLPVGASGRASLLLSGGIDSPVAGWFALKRGLTLDAVHFHSYPFTSERSLDKVVRLATELREWGGPERLFVVHFTEAQTQIRASVPPALGVTVMRRLMLRIAERLAQQHGAGALVSGECLGQVASQTLESLSVIGSVVDLPILRPLIGFDKAEIMARARAIETYETSILPYEDCCSLFVPKHPETRPRQRQVEAAEAALDVEALVEGAIAKTELNAFSPTGATGSPPL